MSNSSRASVASMARYWSSESFADLNNDDVVALRFTLERAADLIEAQRDLQNLAADECARADLMRDLLARAREYVSDALDAYEHSDGRELLTEIDAVLPKEQGQ